MEREVSAATMIGVTLCALGVLLSIIFFTVSIGNEIKSSAYNKAVDIQVRTESGTLRDLRGVDTELSMAAVFGIIQNCDNYIGDIDASRIDPSGSAKNKEESIKFIRNNISGRVRLAVKYNFDGSYLLELHEVYCKDAYSEHDVCQGG